MSKDDSAEERVRAQFREIEESAAEIVLLGDLLFRAGEPTDPALQRRYRALHAREGGGGAAARA
jgi:hypothetical protein